MKLEIKNGYIEYSIDDMNDEELVIDLVEVVEKRKGTGSKLVNEVIKYAKQNNYKAVTLCAYPQDNTIELKDLVRFYEKLGFDVEYDDGSEVLMKYDF